MPALLGHNVLFEKIGVLAARKLDGEAVVIDARYPSLDRPEGDDSADRWLGLAGDCGTGQRHIDDRTGDRHAAWHHKSGALVARRDARMCASVRPVRAVAGEPLKLSGELFALARRRLNGHRKAGRV